VCTQMEGKEKLLNPKLDGFQKHYSRWKSFDYLSWSYNGRLLLE
jgi:hypothetical protein